MAASQDLMAAMGVLYKGYLYGLIAGIVVLIVSIPMAVALIAYGGRMGATALITDVLIFALAAVTVFLWIFFAYLFKGYRELYRLGFKWAWWLSYGQLILAAVSIAAVIALALYFSALVRSHISSPSPWPVVAAILGPTLLALAPPLLLSFVINVAHIILLRDLHGATKVGEFQIAYPLLIVGVALIYVGILLQPIALVALGISLAEYIVEMIAYKKASAPPP
ncbi:MAG: hypothetical protein JZD41_00580, partial [Thermoproteus sp.]|nr:hypothetical protein [Thermoproteus sp.]